MNERDIPFGMLVSIWMHRRFVATPCPVSLGSVLRLQWHDKKKSEYCLYERQRVPSLILISCTGLNP